MALTLEQAEKIVQGARRKAEEVGVNISVAVVDAGGHLVALSRMDGARLHTPDMARGKAFAAATLQRPSGELAQNAFYVAGPQVAGGLIVPLPGGVPIRQGEQVIGAVGVGGGAEHDVPCAEAGLAALQG